MAQPHEITFPDGTVGAFVELHEHNATIARLTAERDGVIAQNVQLECLLLNGTPSFKRVREQLNQARARAKAAYERAALEAEFVENSYMARRIRALATEAETTALAEMLDAETRACAQIVRDNGMSSMAGEKAILARIDQRKEHRP